MTQTVHLSKAEPVGPCTIIIFGASGDLAMKKLLPALYDLDCCGERMLAPQTMILGCSRRSMTMEQFRHEVLDAVSHHSRNGLREPCCGTFASRLDYLGGIDNLQGFTRLHERLEQIEAASGLPPNRLYYLAIPPDAILKWVELLHEAGLISPPGGPGLSRVVVEKPIGTDLTSATAINKALGNYLAESQIFRIDHYLGKETVRNFLVLRFGNSIFEQVWNNRHIDNVQITVAENEGVGARAGYYDRAGALRDMVQNHLFQLLSLIAMEPPATLEADAIHDAKYNVLRAIEPLSADQVKSQVVRAQYTAGEVDGKAVCGYLSERDVAKDSTVETFVALKLFINNWRWSGVPFYLRTGKRMSQRNSSVAIHFKPLPRILFAQRHALPPDILTLRIQPDEGFSLSVATKQPGLDLAIRPVRMDLAYASAFGAASSPQAYEMLLYEVMGGDQTLFVRPEMIERSWQFVQSILDVWKSEGSDLSTYAAGSWGPADADRLLAAGFHCWFEPCLPCMD